MKRLSFWTGEYTCPSGVPASSSFPQVFRSTLSPLQREILIFKPRPFRLKRTHARRRVSSPLALIAIAIVLGTTVGATGCGILPVPGGGSGSSSGGNGTPGGGQPATSSHLSPSSTSVSFGNLTVGNSTVQPVTLMDVGTANITISNVSATGSGFTATGGLNVTLTPNQSVTVDVNFNPTGAGAVTGSLSISSSATNSLVQLGLSGTGVAQVITHKVALNWQPSTSAVIGYFVYRGPAASSLSKLTGSLDPSPSYTDTSVVGGHTYVYAVTSVDSTNAESAQSSPLSVTIPSQ
jgi:hypothetical protein